VGEAPAHFSFDIDALDPAYAPGTGTPEAGGLTPLEAQRLIRELGSLNFVGADLVEVSPPCDTSGITSITAAAILFDWDDVSEIPAHERRSEHGAAASEFEIIDRRRPDELWR
jgi:Arginase family